MAKKGDDWKVTSKDWEKVKQTLVSSKTNGGFPYLVVKDGDYQGNRELYLSHQYEGVELDETYIEKTMPNVQHLWGKPVYLETVMDEKPVLFSYQKELEKKAISS